ncbi:MAG: hypothetical protein LAT56_14135 [Wenzhouxiangella sp.]|nr:hypothetical protein [Wenzhouxiangella sp.]
MRRFSAASARRPSTRKAARTAAASGRLQADSRLSGRYEPDRVDVDLDELMGIIDAARAEEMERRERLREPIEDELYGCAPKFVARGNVPGTMVRWPPVVWD